MFVPLVWIPTLRMFHAVPLVWICNPDPLSIRIFNPDDYLCNSWGG